MITAIQKPDIVDVISQYAELTPRGRNLWTCCPLPGHSERTPSFKVDPEKQSFYCFGCSEYGDAIAFIQKYRNLSFKDACKYLGIGIGKPSPAMQKQQAIERRKRELVKGFRKWESLSHSRICRLYRAVNRILSGIKNESDIERYGDLYHYRTELENILDVLEGRDDEAKYSLYMWGRS